MNRSGDRRADPFQSHQFDDEWNFKQPESINDVQKLIAAHPVVSLNAALLLGVAVGWLAKRL